MNVRLATTIVLLAAAVQLVSLADASTATDQANQTAQSVNDGLSTVQIILLAIFGPVIGILILLAVWKLITTIVHKVGAGMSGGSKGG